MQYYVVVAADEHNTHGICLNDVPADIGGYTPDACDGYVPQLTASAVTCPPNIDYMDADLLLYLFFQRLWLLKVSASHPPHSVSSE